METEKLSEVRQKYLEDMVRGYIVCALWSSVDYDDVSLDRDYTPEDLSRDARNVSISDCKAFMNAHWDIVQKYSAEHVGHDFWLSRNGHGSGFFDGDGDDYRSLQPMAKTYGSVYLYVTDDNKINIM